MNPQHFTVVEMQHNRAEFEYLHNGAAGISTAFEIKEKAEIKLNIPRALGTTCAYMEIYDENANRFILEIEGEWQGIDGKYDCYVFDIDSEHLGVGLYFIRPRLSVLGATLFGHKWAGGIYFDYKSQLTNMMQLSLCKFKYKEPKKIRGGVIYHVFVDRFRRGGESIVPDGATVVPGEWKIVAEYPDYPGAPLYNNKFFGGTLWGVIEKLDYIKSLGTTAIYLSPIFRAASNHKYDTADYLTVDPIFGGESAFKALLKAAKAKGIEIILDGVFNHTGSDSIYFNRYGRYEELGAYQSRKSKYFDWYDFQSFPSQYTSWWGIDTLPRINPDNPECGEFFVGEGGVIDKYAKMGVYGFRLDVADELSDNFIARIKNRLAAPAKDRILYGEVWEDASNKSSYGNRRRYYLGEELDGVMNYPLRTGIIDYLTDRGIEALAYALTDVTNNAPSHVLHNQMNLLGTHDTERILTMLGNEDVSGYSNHRLAKHHMDPGRRNFAIKKLICAYTILSTVPGIPTIFYGDEAGLEGYRDPFNRMPYPWGKEERRLVEHYRKMGRIRRENQVYKSGDFKLLNIDSELLAFARYDGENQYITVVNNTDNEITLSLDNEGLDLFTDFTSNSFVISAFTAQVYKTLTHTTIEIN